MSGRTRKKSERSEKNKLNIRRVVHDVMMYTLPKCGIPETSLPPTDAKEYFYNRDNFVEIAGVCTLRVALTMRDRWRRMFISRRNSSGFNAENIPTFLEKIALCCPLSYSNTTQSIVNATFALCNEILLFFHHEELGIDLGMVMDSASKYVTSVITINPFVPENIEDLFDRFDNITMYAQWIADFVTNFAIPYGSREDVSELFSEHVKIQWKNFKTGFSDKPPTKVLRDYLGFLPDHLFEDIALEDSDESSDNIVQEPTFPEDDDAREPPKPAASSESGAVGSQSCDQRSPELANVSEQAAQDEQNNNPSLEDDLEQLNLGAEGASRERQCGPEQKQRKKRKPSKKKRN